MSVEHIIELKGIKKRFEDNFEAVKDFNLQVKKGEFVTFLGPSGCGKTTTLRMIAGFDIPTEGQILLNGEDISKLPPNKRPINTVFQRYALFPHLNIFDNIAFGLKLKKTPKQTIGKKVKAALKMVGMTDYEYRDVDSLSGGQQQRVGIARAFVTDPSVVFADEPTGNLDSKTTFEVMELIQKLVYTKNQTLVMVNHDSNVAKYSDIIVNICDGKITSKDYNTK